MVRVNMTSYPSCSHHFLQHKSSNMQSNEHLQNNREVEFSVPGVSDSHKKNITENFSLDHHHRQSSDDKGRPAYKTHIHGRCVPF